MQLKLLKKINFLDLIGVAIFFSILATAAFFFLRRSEYVTITLRVSESDSLNIWSMPPNWYVSSLKPGMASTDFLGRSTLEIIDVYEYLTREMNSLVYVTLKVRSVYNKRTNEYSYNGSTLLVGSYQQFKVDGVLITGVIHSVQKEETKEQKRFLITGYVSPSAVDSSVYAAETIATGIPRYVSKQIVDGLKYSNRKGEALAEIVKVMKSPAQRRFIYDRQLISIADPEFERVELQIELLAEKNGEFYFFRQETPLTVNKMIYIHFPEVTVPLIITEIQAQ